MATEDQCAQCGERNPPGSAFCVLCGNYLGWNREGSGPTGPGPSGGSVKPPVPGPQTTPHVGTGYVPQVTQQPGTRQTVSQAPAAQPGGCPRCGRVNPSNLRFCSNCGTLLQSIPQAGRPPIQPPFPRRRWWPFSNPDERSARRAYRESLPAFYRWRRVLIALLALGAAVGLVLALNRDVLGSLKDHWDELTSDTVVLDDVDAVAEPENPEYSSDGVTDGAPEEAWATKWPTDTRPSDGCGGASGIGTLTMVFEPTRVTGLKVWAGVTAGDRFRQFRPRELAILADGKCYPGKLDDKTGGQRVALDTEIEVDSITIAVASTFPPKKAPEKELVAIGQIDVLTKQ